MGSRSTTLRERRARVWLASLVGEAVFALHTGRGVDDLLAEWTASPGEVVLLPGWRPDVVDPRPRHRVDLPTRGPRLMFQVRRLAVPGTPTWPDRLTELAARPPSERHHRAALLRATRTFGRIARCRSTSTVPHSSPVPSRC